MGVLITGGIYRGRKLATDTRAGVIRPTSGKVREALFSALGDRVEGAVFLDLYAGSGAVGLEALSRGAAESVLVENHGQSWALLKANCESLSAGPRARATGAAPVRAEAGAFCRRMQAEGRRFDLAFADPPFDTDYSGLRVMLLGVLAPQGMAIIQFPWRNPPVWLGTASKVKRYGESGLVYI